MKCFKRISQMGVFVGVWLAFSLMAQASHKCPKSPSFEYSRAVKPPFMYSTTYTVSNLPLATFSAIARSSNTSGCSEGHPSDRFYKPAGVSYLEDTMRFLAEDLARGQGAHLQALSHLSGCPVELLPEFATTLQPHYFKFFAADPLLSDESRAFFIWEALPQALADSEILSQSCRFPAS